jgi:hypothetical protein
VLGYAVLVSVQDPSIGLVAKRLQRFAKARQDGAVVPLSQVRNVLEEHRSWFQYFDYANEALPKIHTRINP